MLGKLSLSNLSGTTCRHKDSFIDHSAVTVLVIQLLHYCL